MIRPQTLSLDGLDWTVYWQEPGEWERRRIWEQEPPEAAERRQTVAVPGNALEDPAAEADWIYERRFTVPADLDGAYFQLRFEGIADTARVFLNGEPVGRHQAEFVPAEWDVTRLLRVNRENHLLAVVSRSPSNHPTVNQPAGLWDSVELRVTGPARFQSTALYTNLSRERTEAAISIVSEFRAERPISARVLTEITLDGLPVTSVEDAATLFPGDTSLVQSCEITRVQLWWPNGHGKQPLYEARMMLVSQDEQVLDQRTFRFGVRHVEAVPVEGTSPDTLPTLHVNGKAVRIQGWKWSALDPLTGRVTEERYEQFLRLAREGHVNLLRVTGLLEKEAFYRLCDRYGIMVWQDFPLFEGAELPVDDARIERVRDQAEGMLPRRRNHPSLVLWCGAGDRSGVDDSHPALAELRAAVETEDPQRLWAAVAPPSRQPEGDPILHAQRLQCAVEATRRGASPGILLPHFHDTAPDAPGWSPVDFQGQPRPVYHAVRRAFAPFHVSADFATSSWAGEGEFRAEIWLHNDGPERSLLNVVVTLADLQGRELYQENLAGEAPENGSEAVDTVSWRFPPHFAAPFLLFLEVIDEEGETIARSHYLHSRAPEPPFAALDNSAYEEKVRAFYGR